MNFVNLALIFSISYLTSKVFSFSSVSRGEKTTKCRLRWNTLHTCAAYDSIGIDILHASMRVALSIPREIPTGLVAKSVATPLTQGAYKWIDPPCQANKYNASLWLLSKGLPEWGGSHQLRGPEVP